jgi:ferritin-like protein
MASGSAQFHESEERLKPVTLDRHRALVSLMEELEAIDWYDQRIDGTDDAELAAILAHNRDEEKEHASMLMEWLRRQDPVLDRNLRRYLFTGGSIAEMARASEDEPIGELVGHGGASLGIGSLRDKG